MFLADPRASTTACVQPPFGEKYEEIIGEDWSAALRGRDRHRRGRRNRRRRVFIDGKMIQKSGVK